MANCRITITRKSEVRDEHLLVVIDALSAVCNLGKSDSIHVTEAHVYARNVPCVDIAVHYLTDTYARDCRDAERWAVDLVGKLQRSKQFPKEFLSPKKTRMTVTFGNGATVPLRQK